jgi:chromosomal replication initiator protein
VSWSAQPILGFADLSGTAYARAGGNCLADLLPQRQSVLPEHIVELVPGNGKQPPECAGRDRSEDRRAAQVAMYLMRKETDASLPQIGAVLGGRDHTTVMYAIDKIANQIETKAELRKRVINVKQQLYGQGAVI